MSVRTAQLPAQGGQSRGRPGSRVRLLATVLVTALLLTPLPARADATHSATPVRAAFYYPWFPEAERWATRYSPSRGRYDSSDPEVLNTHVNQAKYAGLDAFISSYWGADSPTGKRLPLLLAAAANQDFHIAAYYERESEPVPPTLPTLAADLSSLADQAKSRAWLRVDGKPVLFVYNTGLEASCRAVERLRKVNAGRFYLNMKVFHGYRSCTVQPDSWHQYGPAVRYDQQSAYSATVSPGFYKFNERAPRLRRDPTEFVAALDRQQRSEAQWQLITSFNEWGEGTSVESAREWASKSGHGVYLDALRRAYLG